VGVVVGTLDVYASYEYALGLEKRVVTYLVIASPVVTALATIVAPLSKALWKERAYPVALGMWMILGLCGWFLFSTTSDRAWKTKAAEASEHTARILAVGRAKSRLEEAVAEESPSFRTRVSAAKANPNCQRLSSCRSLLQQAEDTTKRIEAATAALSEAEKAATQQNPYQAPSWLLPVCMLVTAFFFVWAAFTGPWIERSKPDPKEELKEFSKSLLTLVAEKLGMVRKPV